MLNKSKNVDSYWKSKSLAFTKQYVSILGFPLSPVGIFLKVRYQKIAKLLDLFHGKILLDVGCGSGVFMKIGIEKGKKVIGIDYSEQMLKMAQHNLINYQKNTFILKKGNATNLPVLSNSIDILLASGLTDYLTASEVQLFFKEVKRVLKINGHVIITFPKKRSPLAFLRSGIGLMLREKLLHLPPIEQAFSQVDINRLFHIANIKPIRWDDVLFTMYIVSGIKT